MSVPIQISTAELPRYLYQNPQIPDQIAKGRHSKIEYNGLVLNNRFLPDRYFVTEVDGLGGSDIRDAREPKPQMVGEIPYDAYWGGNTMTISGTIEAGNAWEAERMARDLEAAFGTLQESPMKFNWWDVHDEFSDVLTSSAFWKSLGGAFDFPGDGTMRFGAEGGQAYYALRQYVDHMVTAKFYFPLITDGDVTASVMAKCSGTTECILLTQSSTALFLTVGGTVLIAESYTPSPTIPVWLQLVMIGDIITCNLYEADPFLTDTPPVVTFDVALVGALADGYGDYQQGYAGVTAVGSGQMAALAIEDFRVDALWPSDFVQYVRPIASPIVKSVMQTSNNKYNADFQLVVRASNPKWTSPLAQSPTSPILTPENGYVLGRLYSRTYTLVYSTPINSAGAPTTFAPAATAPMVTCVNRGTWDADTVIIIYGGVTNPILQNLDNGLQMKLNCTIAVGDFIVCDSAAQRFTNSGGGDIFGIFDPTSDFITLSPDVNRILLSGQSPSGAYFTLFFQNTWK